jgi:hypothetical protein
MTEGNEAAMNTTSQDEPSQARGPKMEPPKHTA